MSVHAQINAHLMAAERNPLKRGQHLLAATQYAEANGIPHFGRWSEESITKRAAIQRLRAEERRIKNRGLPESKTPAQSSETRSAGARALPANAEETK
jgi:hypothetical protein